jgi:glycosyltransferase involved in cell wall biosynthesis
MHVTMHLLQPPLIKWMSEAAVLVIPLQDSFRKNQQCVLFKPAEISLSVVITVLQETYSIRETVERVMEEDHEGYIKEFILMASPKSSPATLTICDDLAREYPMVKVYIQKESPGVGHAIREGIERASGSHVALLASDLETEPEAIDRMVQKIKETGCDVVTGSRWLSGGGFKKYGMIKLICNWCFQKIFKVLFHTKLTDISYGYKILSKAIADKIDWSGEFHEIYIETTIKPLAAGCRVEEIPTTWTAREEGKSANSFFKNFIYVKKAFAVLFHAERITKN